MAVSSKNEYVEMNEKFGGDMTKMFGPTLLGFPTDVDASRLNMFTAESKQSLSVINPDVARIQSSFENIFGRQNRAYKKLEGRWEIKAILPKFKNGAIYTMVLYNQDKDLYEMIEKPITENLTEKFGYIYNTSMMDSLNVGDIVKDPILFKSTSYDDHMNYRYGKNARVYYSTSTDTIEDAVKIRQGWADGVKTIESDIVQVPINENNVPLNICGTDSEYKSFADIGEPILNSTVFATRMINKDHLFVDFQSKNMREVCSTDIDYFVTEDSTIYDINIYYNNPNPFPDNVFFRQLKGYYDDICHYASEILHWASVIKESGSNYTENVSYCKSRYQHFNDPEFKWKSKENKAFSNMIVEFKVKSVVGLDAGSKIAGRYGDKGVISKVVSDDNVRNAVTNTMDSILDMLGRDINEEERRKLASEIQIIPDSKMPYTDDFPVDIILNSSGAIRRLTQI